MKQMDIIERLEVLYFTKYIKNKLRRLGRQMKRKLSPWCKAVKIEMKQMDIVERLEEVLKKEYGIKNREEFVEAVNNFDGIDLGIFTEPFTERKDMKAG
jgi:hypothetical protein